MAKTQPLLTVPAAKVHSAPVTLATTAPAPSKLVTEIDSIPLPFCWAVFGISAVTLLIQIWNYFSS
jgi:hypothetical protein